VKGFLSGGVLLCLLSLNTPSGHAQQQPAAPEGPTTPASQNPAPPPIPPKPAEVLLQDEGTVSLTVSVWLPNGHPSFDAGRATVSGTASLIDFQGEDKLGRSLSMSFPAAKHNAVRISYFDTKADGNFTAANNLNPWGTFFNSGDYMATYYRVRDVKISFDYLTWPYPVQQRRFRLRTLWQAQYVTVDSTFFAPLSTTDIGVATGSKSIILPTLGIGVAEYLSKNVRVEAEASGFDIPHHANIGDVEADIAYKIGPVEVRGGGKFFHFETSPAADFFMKGTLAGADVGLRVYLWH
jgi:hypothetical protein